MYTSTVEGTTALPAKSGIGNVTKSGRKEKLRRHCRPPRRIERDHARDPEMVSPTCVAVSVAGSERVQLESYRM